MIQRSCPLSFPDDALLIRHQRKKNVLILKGQESRVVLPIFKSKILTSVSPNEIAMFSLSLANLVNILSLQSQLVQDVVSVFEGEGRLDI